MSTSSEHYQNHLGPIYLWMAGGARAALDAGRAEVDALNLPLAAGATVVDLGAGFGMHAIALAQQGVHVLAIDSSACMLGTLEELRGTLPVRAVVDDLLAFAQHLTRPPAAILCLGDTITHLPDHDAVTALIERARLALPPAGVFVVGLRDYSVPLVGDRRFIPVRSDASRLLTCFLEYAATTVTVHDIVQELTPQGWQTRISHYPKLRLAPGELARDIARAGFDVRQEAGTGGMVRLVAHRL